MPTLPAKPWTDGDVTVDGSLTYHDPPGVWRSTNVEVPATVSMTTPADPQPGNTRWNVDADPPATAGDVTQANVYDVVKDILVQGTNVTLTTDDGADTVTIDATGDSEVYTAVKAMLVQGTNVTLVPNDGTEQITVNSSAGSSGGDGLFTALNATDYGLATSATAATNTAALKACINAAIGANRNVFIPAGTYQVNNGCLTPNLGQFHYGLHIFGEGMYRSVLQMATQSSESYFYNNSSNGNTLSFATFRDLGFQGGPVSTGAERANVNPNHNGFRLYGPTDQNFRFIRCRFATLNGVWFSAGSNNASEIAFDNCKITHIEDYVVRLSNFQALNVNFINSDVEIVWGDVVRTEGTGGGAVNFTMGSIIVQRDGSNRGCLVRLLAQQSATVTFMGVRIEVRNDAMLVDGSASTGVGNINFISCGTFTNALSGAVNTVIVNTDQAVNFDKCTFEHNGSYATYTVLGTGWLTFDKCAVRPSLASEISVSASGTAKAINCRGRFAQTTAIDFSL